MNAWQKFIYATVYAFATAWFDAQKASLRGVEEYPSTDDLSRADAFRDAVVRSGQSGNPGGNDPASTGAANTG